MRFLRRSASSPSAAAGSPAVRYSNAAVPSAVAVRRFELSSTKTSPASWPHAGHAPVRGRRRRAGTRRADAVR
jgi:hypothetical protein